MQQEYYTLGIIVLVSVILTAASKEQTKTPNETLISPHKEQEKH